MSRDRMIWGFRGWVRRWLCALLVVGIVVFTGRGMAAVDPLAVSGFTVDTSNRMDTLLFYQRSYMASENYAAEMAWTGSIASLQAGTTSAVFKNDVLRRINYFRAMAGLPSDVYFDATKSSKCQQAALMMSANSSVSHTPPTSWLGYTAEGAEAAGASDLALGVYGPGAISGYMIDDGTGNEPVGHRRWILYPPAQEMGTGDVLGSGTTNYPANATWVVGNFKTSVPRAFVPWPSSGYFPVTLLPARWSISYPGANFSAASVTMTHLGQSVPVTVVSRTVGYGDNSIVWTATGLPSSVSADESYQVTVSGITGTGVPSSTSYTVVVFDPSELNEWPQIAGVDTPHTAGQLYHFSPVNRADSYGLEVSTLSTSTWLEGAEDSPVPQITSNISPGYTLRQTGLKRTGTKAFQLAFPSGYFADQSFTIVRGMIPTATSKLQYYDRARYSMTTNTFETQISTDEGVNWTLLTSRNGVGYTSTDIDSIWNLRSLDLSAYAGKVVQIRFVLKSNAGAVVPGTTSSYGFFVDDVTITNSYQMTNRQVTTLVADQSSFLFNSTTVGAPLVANGKYGMRMRPILEGKSYDFGNLKIVTATSTATLPVISAQPASQTVVAGNVGVLQVTAEAVGLMSYQWYQGAVGVTTTPVGTNSSKYTTPALSQTTSYWVKITTAAGSVSSTGAVITVMPTFQSWAVQYETSRQLAAGTISQQPTQDWDHDGRVNFLEFALGTSPVLADDSGALLPTIQASAVKLILSYRVDRSLAGISYVPEVSLGMGSWMALGAPEAPDGFEDVVVSTTGSIEVHEARVPKQGHASLFMRLRVSGGP